MHHWLAPLSEFTFLTMSDAPLFVDNGEHNEPLQRTRDSLAIKNFDGRNRHMDPEAIYPKTLSERAVLGKGPSLRSDDKVNLLGVSQGEERVN